MNYQNLYYAIVVFVILTLALFYTTPALKERNKCLLCVKSEVITSDAPPSLRMYDAIVKYSKKYKVPKKYAFGIAYQETRYSGPFDWKYKPSQTSNVGAVGPMQIMPSTAKMMWKDSVFSERDLQYNIDFNVKTSMKILRYLYDQYGDWKKVFGYYNTGKPIINDYAISVFNHEPNWSIK